MISAIIGLGNFGNKYDGTRHNLGFELLNLISREWKIAPKPADGDYFLAEKQIKKDIIRLFWPTTLMNNSGLAALQIIEKYDLTPNSVLVACDDINLPLGKIRIRAGGSDGGHNGLRSIIYDLGTEDFPRLRMGIGPLSEGADQVEFVLGKFTSSEMDIMKKMLVKSGQAVLYSLKNRLDEAMSIYNINPAPG